MNLAKSLNSVFGTLWFCVPREYTLQPGLGGPKCPSLKQASPKNGGTFAMADNHDPSRFSNTFVTQIMPMLSKTIAALVWFFKSAVASRQCQRLISPPRSCRTCLRRADREERKHSAEVSKTNYPETTSPASQARRAPKPPGTCPS